MYGIILVDICEFDLVGMVSNLDLRKKNERVYGVQKYEYKCVSIFGLGRGTTRVLNEYAKDGWELVVVSWAWHYFKRPVEGR